MAVQAVIDPAERGHLFGDVPALLLVAIVLAFLTPRTPDSSPNPSERPPRPNVNRISLNILRSQTISLTATT